MKNIIGFFLGIFLTISFVAFAQTSGITIFKPATPKEVFVKEYGLPDRAVKDVLKLSTQGYITKSFAFTNNGWCVVIMEKY